MDTHPRFKMVGDMLRKALGKLGRLENPLRHSEQDWQGAFTRQQSRAYRRVLTENGRGQRPVRAVVLSRV